MAKMKAGSRAPELGQLQALHRHRFFPLLLPALFQITWCLGTTACFLFAAQSVFLLLLHLAQTLLAASVLCSSLLFLALPNRGHELWGHPVG